MTPRVSPSRTDRWLFVALLAACIPIVAAYGPLDGNAPAVTLAATVAWAPIVLAGVLMAALVARRWVSAVVVALALGAHIALLLPMATVSKATGSEEVVVMTANILYGGADPAALVEQVRKERVQVLAVQELTPSAVRALSAAGLDSILPYSLVDAAESSAGTGLWSARPLTREPAWQTSFRSTAGVLTVGARELTVMTVHPERPRATSTSAWHLDYARLRSAAARDPHVDRVVLLGDFNASVHHRELRQLMGQRWRDAGEVAGARMVRTWAPLPGMPGIVDLDHVLVPADVEVREFAVHPIRGSDHRAVMATLVLTG